MKEVTIYTDGACSGNPGPGGWAALLVFNGEEKEVVGYEPDTTNNRMELQAVINGLQSLKESCQVTVYADSAYIVNCINDDWISGWKRNGWRRGKKKEPVMNVDLWKALDAELDRHDVTFKKVKGHSGHVHNDRVDGLATEQIRLHA